MATQQNIKGVGTKYTHAMSSVTVQLKPNTEYIFYQQAINILWCCCLKITIIF